MALDPSIILQAGKGVTPLLSPADIQAQQMERQVGQYKLNALRQQADDDAAYRNVLRSGVSADELPNKLYGAGLGKQAMEAQKFQLEQQKAARDAEKGKLENALKHFEVVGQAMSGVVDQPTYDIARQTIAQHLGPEAAAKIPTAYDPAAIERGRAQAMSVKDQMEQRYKALAQTETARHNAATEATGARNASTAEGQLAVSQGNLTARQQENAAGKVPAGYRQAAGGGLEFIPGGPADPTTKPAGGKPLNEGQSKALLFGTRMAEANDILESMAAKGVDQPGLIKRGAEAIGVGGAANWTQSANQQQVEQAQRDFINATLRRESGAAIAESEFENARKQYFPQVGDKPDVIANKKRNREVAMRGILAEVPEADQRVAQVRGKASEPAKPADKAAYDALPSGALFIAPDGSKRRKP